VSLTGPGTFVTDSLLAAFTLWLAWRLFREAYRLRERSIALWLGAFGAAAASGILGILWHSLSQRIDPRAGTLLWTGSLVLASTSSLLFLLAILRVYTSGRLLGVLGGVAVAKFALFAMWIALNDSSSLVVYDSALTMFVIVVLSCWGAWARHLPSAPWILFGVLVSMLAELFQQGRVSISPHFDHNDLYHVIQMGAMYLLCRGGLLLREREGNANAPDFEATQPLPVTGEE
jgi:Family of unknown function (DUF6962)